MQRYDYTTQRLFVGDDLDAGGVICAERSQSNYLLSVLRMKQGAHLLVFNGRHGEWLGEISITGRKSCDINVVSQIRSQPEPPDLVYIFAPLKKGRLDYMVQKAVEMGVGQLQPVITAHTQIKKLNLERLRANIIEASEQCGILAVPQICQAVPLGVLLKDWNAERQIIYGDEATERDNSLELLAGLKGQKLALLIGPEGGFSEDERTQLRGASYVRPISLGPRILRADTAAVAALAVLQATAGDW